MIKKLEKLNFDGEKDKNEIMIGSIISRVKTGNDDIQEINQNLRDLEFA